MASASSTLQPLRVTATDDPATHVVKVCRFSKLRKKYRGDDGYLCSETFTVAGLDWAVEVQPDGEADEQGYVGVFARLVTEGAAAWAHVSFGLVDRNTGRTVAFFSHEDPVLFDAGAYYGCNWGTGKLASWRRDLRRSRYIRHDCLQIECSIDVCHDHLAFQDAPTPKTTPRNVDAAGELCSAEGADVSIHVGAAEPIPAHSSVLDAYARRFLKKHNLARRQRPKATAAGEHAMRVNVDDMPRPAVEALLQFVYTDTLPVVTGLSGDGYRDMFRHLLLAAKRYSMRRLSAICERVLSRCIEVETAAAMLAIAHRQGLKQLKEACLEFASDPENHGLVRRSKGYAELWCWETLTVKRQLWAKYCERSGCDESQESEMYYY